MERLSDYREESHAEMAEEGMKRGMKERKKRKGEQLPEIN